MNEPALLQVRDLKAYFRTGAGLARAVDGVTFDIRRGETFALVGESGCGKSVTALAILRLLQQPAGHIAGGSILFEGRDLVRLPPPEMRRIRGNRISMIFQEPMTALNPVFTVGHQIAEVLELHQGLNAKQARRRSLELMERVGIPDATRRMDEYPHQLSGGQRQRVMIAMAIGCKPALLIADEPTTALDVTVQAQVFALIKELVHDEGTALLLITHDMGVVYENAERVAVMYAGRIVEEALRAALFERPSHPYTRLLMRSMPSRSVRGRRLATIEGVVPLPTEFPAGCRFANRCPHALLRCRTDSPPDFKVNAFHRSACWLLESSVPQAATAEDATALASDSPAEASVRRIEIRDLKVHFFIRKGFFKRVVARVHAVDGVDLHVLKGETLALVGESGCGKTTVGKGIVRLADITGGSIRFHGEELVGMTRSKLKPYRQRIQIVFQDPQSSLNPRMMVGDAMLEGMETHSIGTDEADRRRRIAVLMEKVGLRPDMALRYPHEFSGGQRQRVGLARALAVEPELIVCDEATSSLDVSVQAQALNLLKDLQRDMGLSYLFITHDMSVVQYLADRVAVMYLGRIVEEGTVGEVFANPRHPYTQALLSAVPQIDGPGRKRIVLQGDVPSPINPPSGCHFHPRCPQAMPVCREQYPAASTFSATQRCRCWLYENPPG